MLGLSRTASTDPTSVQELLDQHFTKWEEQYGIIEKRGNMAARFADIIIKAHETTGERVVVLVDEYDNALINTLHNRELHDRNQELLKSVYSNLKDLDAHIKFGMLTGVSRFSKLNIFSGLNHLQDITFDTPYSSICGITAQELKDNFEYGIQELSETRKWSMEETFKRLKDYYDGYHFTQNSPDIYNPFSLLNAFNKNKLGNYWFTTGVPSFLVERMKRGDIELERFMNQRVDETILNDIDSARNSTVATLFQAGFLTIKQYDEEWELYKLGIPNLEVRDGMSWLFSEYFLNTGRAEGQNTVINLIQAAREGEPEDFLMILKGFLAGVPFDMSKGSKEVYFHNAFFIISSLIGLKTRSEYHTSDGSIDLLIETGEYIYLFEFKMDSTAEKAMKQIEDKNYTLPFESDGRKIFKVGVNFSSEKRNIDSWLIF